jgi:hypothetical protein
MHEPSRHMNEVTSSSGRQVFPARTPADFADARQDVSDRLLLAVMVNSGAGARLDFEQRAPHRRFDAEPRRDAARRSEPGVRAVPLSNSAGPTMRAEGLVSLAIAALLQRNRCTPLRSK